MHRFVKTTLFVALVAVGLAGCQELTVPNLNNPERERVLSEPQDVEALIAGTWTQVWALWQGGNYPALQLSAIADEFTTTHENWGGWTLSSEPRTRFDNHPEYTYSALAENPYYNTYDALASVHDGLEAILETIVYTDRKSTRLNSSHVATSYAVFCLKKKESPVRLAHLPASALHRASRLAVRARLAPLRAPRRRASARRRAWSCPPAWPLPLGLPPLPTRRSSDLVYLLCACGEPVLQHVRCSG